MQIQCLLLLPGLIQGILLAPDLLIEITKSSKKKLATPWLLQPRYYTTPDAQGTAKLEEFEL